MDKGRFLVEAHLKEGTPVLELAARHGVHFSYIYRLLARYREGGEAALAPRSRRPKTCPSATPATVEDEVVTIRKHLSEEGLDAGAQTIFWHLERRHGASPSVSTIHRILRRRGFVVDQPKKRPKSSWIRFVADLPNECWQTDVTHFELTGGRAVEILNFEDDHSRLCVASVALKVTKTTDVVKALYQARTTYGTPAAILSDNGAIYTGKYRLGQVLFEMELDRLGITAKHSAPYHPQTCGKVERFHQTLKKYLAARKRARSIPELQGQIDWFVSYYNEERPHRALGRKTPQEVFDSKVKAHPKKQVPDGYFRKRLDRVDYCGKLTIRYAGKIRHIGMGAPFKGLRVEMYVADAEVRILSTGGDLLRTLTLDSGRDYHPQTLGWTSTMSRHSIRR